MVSCCLSFVVARCSLFVCLFVFGLGVCSSSFVVFWFVVRCSLFVCCCLLVVVGVLLFVMCCLLCVLFVCVCYLFHVVR